MISSGFILTSLPWAWMLASIIDRRLNVAGAYAAAAVLLVGWSKIAPP